MNEHTSPDSTSGPFDSFQSNDFSHGDSSGGDPSGGDGFGAGLGGSATNSPEDGGGTTRKPRARRSRAKKSKAAAKPRARSTAEDAPALDSDSLDEAPKRKPATRKKRTRRKSTRSADESTDSRDERDSTSDGETSSAPARRKRTRRKKTSTSRSDQDDEVRGEPRSRPGQDREDDRDDDREGEDGAEKKRRRRGSRGGRRRKKVTSSDKPSKERDRSDASRDGATVDSIPGEDDELPASTRARSQSKKKRKRTSTRKKDTESEESDEEKLAAAEVLRTDVIYINAADPEEKRVAVVGKDGRIHDLLMTSESQKTLVNDIYRGRVVNLEPAIGAAFVDFGQGRNGFLHTSDVLPVYGEDDFTLDQLLTASVDPDEWDSSSSPTNAENVDEHSDEEEEEEEEEADDGKRSKAPAKRKKAKAKTVRGKGKKPGKDSLRSSSRRRARLPINDLLKVGDQVVVQVTKDAIGDKGPTLTTYISIPGRYLVLMPSMARTGVSRKIPDDKERRRLKRILTSLKSPTEMGVIVRTAGVGKTKTDLQRDLNYLLGVWETFDNRLKTGRGPAPLYQESDVAIRTLRDLFNKTTKEVLVDDPGVLEQLDAFAERLMPEHRDRIKAYKGDRPIFHEAGLEQDFERIFARRVELASGGSVVFDQAEALVAIDVNSGRTRTDSFDFEEIALKTNLEAVPEIALQIRLRDLGGIIVCDFIDMMKSSSNRAVERALRAELSPDRARSKLGRISQFGLLELTRQRLGPGTHKKVFQACPRCRGTARIRTVESRAQAILRRLGSALTQKGFSQVEVRAHPEVIVYLKERLWDYMRALEHRFERELKLTSVPDQPEDSVLRYLRADGREVRPGGRRKR